MSSHYFDNTVKIHALSENPYFAHQTAVEIHFVFLKFRHYQIKAMGFYFSPLSSSASRDAFNSDSIASMEGRAVFNSFGSAFDNVYSDIPMGALIFCNAYSAITLSFSLHNNKPMDLLSPSCRN